MLAEGVEKLTEAELLAIFLRVGQKRCRDRKFMAKQPRLCQKVSIAAHEEGSSHPPVVHVVFARLYVVSDVSSDLPGNRVSKLKVAENVWREWCMLKGNLTSKRYPRGGA